MKRKLLAVLASTAFALPAWADTPTKVYTFSTLKSPTPEVIKTKVDGWLKTIQASPEVVEKFTTIWNQSERPALDRLADGFAVAIPEISKVLTEARDPAASAPKELPEVFKDAKLEPFVKANLALVYARALSNKRIY